MKRKDAFEAAHPFGQAFSRLIDQFAHLPGVGRKSAERLANHLLDADQREAEALAQAILDVKRLVRRCSTCFNLSEGEVCPICRDGRRDRSSICIVEQPKDVTSLESAGVYTGLYHVLHGRISPLEGVGPEDLTLNELIQRVRRDGVKEIVMATNPTTEGDGTALFITNLLQNDPVRITRLARGIATGSVLEFANREMLADAMRGRQEI
jgi:recombination protein RecR